MTLKYWAIFFIILFCSCNSRQAVNSNSTSDVSITLLIQPFSDMPAYLTDSVFAQLKSVAPHIRLLEPVAMPGFAYYKPRNRYKADSIIKWLSKNTRTGFVTIGLTTKDMSTTNGNIADWGVMGLGYESGNACVASAYRLNRNKLISELFKVAIHELGHTQGLPHCANKTCFMRDAEGHNSTGEETGFCSRCKKLMMEKGFRFEN